MKPTGALNCVPNLVEVELSGLMQSVESELIIDVT